MIKQTHADTLYLCDGLKECRKNWNCYMQGGECKHTTSFKHALYKDSESGYFEECMYECGRVAYWEKM